MRRITIWLFALMLLNMAPLQAQQDKPLRFDISQTVVQMPVAEGVNAEDAINFMKSKAAELNMKIVAHQPVSKELQARGIDSGPLHILQFCNPADAHKMVMHNPLFAAYMPCRIALVEDSAGKLWLTMLDLDILINNAPLTPELHEMATRINQQLHTIMEAGANASF